MTFVWIIYDLDSRIRVCTLSFMSRANSMLSAQTRFFPKRFRWPLKASYGFVYKYPISSRTHARISHARTHAWAMYARMSHTRTHARMSHGRTHACTHEPRTHSRTHEPRQARMHAWTTHACTHAWATHARTHEPRTRAWATHARTHAWATHACTHAWATHACTHAWATHARMSHARTQGSKFILPYKYLYIFYQISFSNYDSQSACVFSRIKCY